MLRGRERTMKTAAVLLTMVAACCLVSLGDAGLYTVTDEAWFKVVVVDLNGPGKNFSGKFEIALFGETVPMTVMNFAAITRGYERPNQVISQFSCCFVIVSLLTVLFGLPFFVQ